MKSPPCASLDPYALQILAYLRAHSRAQDTLQGITEWWLLEQRIRLVIGEVEKALSALVGQGLVLERRGQDGRVHYRLNPRRKRAIARQLAEASSEPAAPPPHARGNSSFEATMEER